MKEAHLDETGLQGDPIRERPQADIVREQPLAACPAECQDGLQKALPALRVGQPCWAAPGQPESSSLPPQAGLPDVPRQQQPLDLPMELQPWVSELAAPWDA